MPLSDLVGLKLLLQHEGAALEGLGRALVAPLGEEVEGGELRGGGVGVSE